MGADIAKDHDLEQFKQTTFYKEFQVESWKVTLESGRQIVP